MAQPAGSSNDFGMGLAVDAASRTLVVGSPGDTVQGQLNAGAAYVYLGFGEIFADGFETPLATKSLRGPACP